MGKFTKEKVNDLADNLLIGLSEEETEMVLKEFEKIDENLNLINEIENLSDVEPMTHCLDDFYYELREDVIEESVPCEYLLQNSDRIKENEIEVPKVVG